MSDRTEQARAEAERQWPSLAHLTQAERAAWKAGGRWADANPKPTTITREELAEAVGILEGEQEEGALGTDALYQALIYLRIEVEVDDAD